MKIVSIVLAVVAVAALGWYVAYGTDRSEQSAELAVRAHVEAFGERLKNVSLLAPPATVHADMQAQYAAYVSPELLAEWISNPTLAPGRLTSSPWPERIEISSVQPDGEGYRVSGKVIEMTSSDTENPAVERDIELMVQKFGGEWRITRVSLAAYTGADVVYENEEYGFTFTLPKSWEGYSIVEDEWEGRAVEDSALVYEGPILSIRHPAWTEDAPRQDIPVMVFTDKQWEDMESGIFHVGAAPMNPSMLGRNSAYVFALPARYNYSFPEGYEEVEEIIQRQPLRVD